MDAKQATANALAEPRRESQSICADLTSTFSPSSPNMPGMCFTSPRFGGFDQSWEAHPGRAVENSTHMMLRRQSRDLQTDLRNPPGAWDTALYTPPGSVSPQEHSQIERKLDGWTSELAVNSPKPPCVFTSYANGPSGLLLFIPKAGLSTSSDMDHTRHDRLPKPPDHAFYPIIYVSASKQVIDGVERRASGFAYIQGSGDDHELWGMGLTPNVYWRHCDKILSMAPSGLPDLVRSLDSASPYTNDATDPNKPLCGTPIQHISGRISICNIASLRRPDLLRTHHDIAFLCLTPDDPNHLTSTVGVLPREEYGIPSIQTPEGKKGQHRRLTVVLPRSMPFIQPPLEPAHRLFRVQHRDGHQCWRSRRCLGDILPLRRIVLLTRKRTQ
ncbi:initiator tRNA phosphoribosyl transferase-domain-containing protein [Butyriboletus roseoflavus]|nr:initiator tRNA phosphoribosyl transferase-domain-containing protein [Butyriboletus roseoflavus]